MAVSVTWVVDGKGEATRRGGSDAIAISEPGTILISKLREDLRGEVITPEDAELRRRAGGVPRRHRQAAGRRSSGRSNAADVAAVVSRLARDSACELAIRSGGHSGPGIRRLRGRDRPRPLGDEGARHRRRRPHGVGRDGTHGRRVLGRGRGARPRDRVRRHGLGRDRRHHARRWRSASSCASTA